MRREFFTLPSKWEKPLMTNDYTNLTEEDKKKIADFIEINSKNHLVFECSNIVSKSYHAEKNHYENIPCEVSDFSFRVDSSI